VPASLILDYFPISHLHQPALTERLEYTHGERFNREQYSTASRIPLAALSGVYARIIRRAFRLNFPRSESFPMMRRSA